MPGVTIANRAPQRRADDRDLLRRGDDAVEPGGLGQRRQPLDLIAPRRRRRPISASAASIQAGQHRHRDDQRRAAASGAPLPRRRRRAPRASSRVPPDACTLTIHTPSRVAAATAPATVFGMSWNFRSRKTRSPRAASSSTIAGPSAGEQPAADLEAADGAAQPVGQRAAPRRRCRRRARRGADPSPVSLPGAGVDACRRDRRARAIPWRCM